MVKSFSQILSLCKKEGSLVARKQHIYYNKKVVKLLQSFSYLSLGN